MTTRTTRMIASCQNCGQISTTTIDEGIIPKVEEQGGIRCHRCGNSVARVTFNTEEK